MGTIFAMLVALFGLTALILFVIYVLVPVLAIGSKLVGAHLYVYWGRDR